MPDNDICTQLSADDDVPFDEEDNSGEENEEDSSGEEEESSDGGNFDDDEDEEDETDDDDEDDGREDSGGGALKAAMSRAKKWPVKKNHCLNLTVSFIGGSGYQRNMVKKHAPEWQQGTGVRFIFLPKSGYKSPGKIRVAFVNDGSSWSKIGTDALTVTNKRLPTMNFGWIDRQNILHEFGHALGLLHEHSSPSVAIPWDKEKVYRYYYEKSGWSRARVDGNIFRRYEKAATNYTKFDPKSIMLYTFPRKFLKANSGWRGINRGEVLSSVDKSFMAKMYPRPRS